MSLKLTTSLSQRLVLTPQMRQRIEMLQMTKLELSDMILAELDQNIMLDEAEAGVAAEDLPEDGATAQEGADAAAPDGSVAGSGSEIAVEAAAAEPDPELGADVEERDPFSEIDFGQTFEEYLDPGYKTQEFEERDEVSFENFLTRPPSLQEQLLWQLGLADVSGD